MIDLIIIGAGGFGLEVAAYAEDAARAGMADFSLKGFLDDTKPAGSLHAGYPVIGKIGPDFDRALSYIIAVGAPEGRKQLADNLDRGGGARLTSVIHPQSYVAASAVIGAGSVIAPFAFAGPAAQCGRHCLFNVHSTAGHESRMGNGCVLSPYASLFGGAQLGENVFLGSHAHVTRGTVGDRARSSAGAVVYNDVPADSLAIGNPAGFRPA